VVNELRADRWHDPIPAKIVAVAADKYVPLGYPTAPADLWPKSKGLPAQETRFHNGLFIHRPVP
jgi:hypothetical protein